MDQQAPPPPLIPIDHLTLHLGLVQKFHAHCAATGRVGLPAIPSLIDEYMALIDNLLTGACRRWAAGTRDQQRATQQKTLDQAIELSPRSMIILDWSTSKDELNISSQVQTLAANYDHWIDGRGAAPFGTHADARVWLLAEELTGGKRDCRVLDIGAGTGRNAIALARFGYPTDAVELSPRFAEQIRATAAALNLTNITVFDGDVFATVDLRDDYKLIVASEVVTDFRSAAQLHALFELAAKRLLPGGLLVFSAFLARDGYTPTPVARELAQHFMCGFFTADEIAAAAAGLPLELIADDSVYDYEKAHLPADAWPPTKWFESWTAGRDAFPGERDASPIELRWLVYQRAY